MQKSKEKVLIFFGIFTAVDRLGKLGLNKRGGVHTLELKQSSAAPLLSTGDQRVAAVRRSVSQRL